VTMENILRKTTSSSMTKSSAFAVNSGQIAQGKMGSKPSASGILKHKAQQSEYSNQMNDGYGTEILSFDEIVLESNEIDLGTLQKEPNFVERRFP